MGDIPSFGQWLKQQRKARDLTQEDLAIRLACSIETVRKIELGLRRPSKQMADLLAQMFGADAQERSALVRFARLGQQARVQAAPSQPSSALSPSDAGEALGTDTLPSPITPLIGRGAEVDTLRHYLLDRRIRLLTLIGPPGIGKTRLAIRVASESAGNFPGGAFFVDLSPVSDVNLVITAIARALGLREAGSQPLQETLRQFVGNRHLLLVLDNFEQVLAAGPSLADLLSGCPQLQAIVTSREALRVHGEQLFPVPALALPLPDRLPPISDLLGYSAIALFVQSAQAVRPDFRLSTDNCAAVVAICSRLDGLPLAIELAAARIKLFSPEEIRSRITGHMPGASLQVLTGGGRDLPARQQTLRGAIDWSYRLLSSGEQMLMRRMSVFVGGSTLSSISAVCNASGDLAMDVVEGVESLLDKSLLRYQQADQVGQQHFIMLDTVREYALERLLESGEEHAIRRYHAEYYLALVEAAEPELQSAQQSGWFNRLEAAYPNLTAALEWCLGVDGEPEPGVAEMGLRIAENLYLFWQVRGRLTEGRAWLSRALQLAQPGDNRVLAKALHAAGWLALFQGDDEAAKDYFSEGIALWRGLNDPWRFSSSLNGLGRVCEYQGEYQKASSVYEESLHLREELDNKWGIAGSLNNLGRVALRMGHYGEAVSRLEGALVLYRQTGDKGSTGIVLNNLALAVLRLADYPRCADLLAESLSLEWEVGYRWGISYCMVALAELARLQGQAERAARLLGSAQTLFETTGGRMDPADRADYTRNLEQTQIELGEGPFSTLLAEGQAMTTEQAVQYALALKL